MAEANASDNTLKRTLGPMNLVALGIGAIIGAGLFVRTAAAAAQNAGPSVTIGFIDNSAHYPDNTGGALAVYRHQQPALSVESGLLF